MNWEAIKALGFTFVRGLAFGMSVTGNASSAKQLNRIADGLQSEQDVDADLQAAADLLNERKLTDADWDAEFAGIEAEAGRLQG